MKALAFAIGVSVLVGCTGIHPVGPFARQQPAPKQPQSQPAAASDIATLQPAPRPAPPTATVLPSEVAIDPIAAAAKLSAELEIDGKSTPNAPATAEVSVIPGRIRVN